jgi:serine/threonine protein kinase
MNQSTRVRRHKEIGSFLASLDDDTIANLIAEVTTKRSGFGGRTARLQVFDMEVFCKMVPLTDLEVGAGVHGSTENVFCLPTYYQYGIGSVGFGAWRELAAHVITTDWVVQGLHEQFPLLHHWRVLRCAEGNVIDKEAYEYLSHAAAIDEDDAVIRRRLDAIGQSKEMIVLITEYFPQTASKWLIEKLNSDLSSAHSAVKFIQQSGRAAISFMQSKNFVHFDTLLDNILTDGCSLYFSDFGLAVHESYALTSDEKHFAARHHAYDAARFASSLVHTICRALPGGEGWLQKLQSIRLHANGFPAQTISALEALAPTASYMAQFSRTLMTTNRKAGFSPPSVDSHLL